MKVVSLSDRPEEVLARLLGSARVVILAVQSLVFVTIYRWLRAVYLQLTAAR